jgi:cyclopropane-fatty-acyl-phospholipid synthase
MTHRFRHVSELDSRPVARRSDGAPGHSAHPAARRGPQGVGRTRQGPPESAAGRRAPRGAEVGTRRSDVATVVRRALPAVAGGRLAALPVTLGFWDGSQLPAAAPVAEAPVVFVREPTALAHLLRQPGQLGLVRAWLDGSLELEGELEAVLATRERFRDLGISRAERLRIALTATRIAGPGVWRRPPVPAIEARISGRRHSLARDRVAVRHHYDVSNHFYRLVLGPSMVYSCAYFATPHDTLEAAQERKLDLICRKLSLAPGERLLDVGCGWGSLALHAAAHYGVRAVGITLSEPQARYARARADAAGLSDRVEVRVADYREIADGPFEKIASVGMYEHVGHGELDRYVAHITGLLAPGGLFLNHGIARLASRPSGPDTFIARYVFPDGELHPIADLISSLHAGGLEIRDAESLREHYPLTLRRWAANLRAHQAEAIAEVGEARERVWRLYMLGSAQAFEAGEITVYQTLAVKHGAPHDLPLDRTELLRTTQPDADEPALRRDHGPLGEPQ